MLEARMYYAVADYTNRQSEVVCEVTSHRITLRPLRLGGNTRWVDPCAPILPTTLDSCRRDCLFFLIRHRKIVGIMRRHGQITMYLTGGISPCFLKKH